ncbi:general stress protein [Rhizobium sp. 2MFCol3.1]|uniref:general stress protein n=1 Tax=Rhizobium sp. 2MFCol3.1 TaxID=1246459 RepID=UPI0003749847|nr:general stress protein [Rhizobium sp. 2MFCol3.1]
MRTVTQLYDSYDDARSAVKALENAGVPSDDISIVTSNASGIDVEGQGSRAAEGAGTGAGVGAVAGGAGGLLTGLGMLAIPGVGPVVAAGWLAATAAGAVAGAVAGGAVGGIVGAMVSEGVPEDEANFYAEGIRRGGSVVTARVEESKIASAQSILSQSHPVDYASRRANYEEQGWNSFDENAEPYSADQIEAERSRYRRG